MGTSHFWMHALISIAHHDCVYAYMHLYIHTCMRTITYLHQCRTKRYSGRHDKKTVIGEWNVYREHTYACSQAEIRRFLSYTRTRTHTYKLKFKFLECQRQGQQKLQEKLGINNPSRFFGCRTGTNTNNARFQPVLRGSGTACSASSAFSIDSTSIASEPWVEVLIFISLHLESTIIWLAKSPLLYG